MIPARPVILCGGSGTRLWPLSRSGFPKQFLCLTGAESLFQQTAKRLMEVTGDGIDLAPLYVVSNEDHRFLVIEQLREMHCELGAALLEPVGRNTAPALTLAALAAQADGGDPVLVVTPADQSVTHNASFTTAIRTAVREASEGGIVILGIAPDRPETGYGYIKAGGDGRDDKALVSLVERFIEKPGVETARGYLDAGGYYWNSGMFVLKASVWLKAIEQYSPDIAKSTRLAWEARDTDQKFVRPGKEAFEAVRSESVDYAVMEPATHSNATNDKTSVKMVALDAGWSDLGAWDAVWKALPKDDFGNAHVGDVLTTDSRNTLVHATSRLVSLVGVENLVVIETPDAVLVVDKSSSQNVKKIVTALNQQRRDEYAVHRKVYRPWGWYDSIDEGPRFKVKRILVKPKASLSLQKHHHRAEHWIVVKGTAEITCGNSCMLLSENQSTYIPLGEVHRLTNPGTIPLEIIEVQSGSYLGEDDIVRFEDNYGRH